MVASSSRSAGHSGAVGMDAGGPSGPAMPHGGTGHSIPPGIFLDPCVQGRRGPGEPLVGMDAAAGVVQACRMGLGGAEAWLLAKGPRVPLAAMCV